MTVVAWRYRWPINGATTSWQLSPTDPSIDRYPVDRCYPGCEIQPLYAQPQPSQQAGAEGVFNGHTHTAIMEKIREDLERQHPDLFSEDSDGEVVIPSGSTPQSAYVKIDISALAEVALAALKPGEE